MLESGIALVVKLGLEATDGFKVVQPVSVETVTVLERAVPETDAHAEVGAVPEIGVPPLLNVETPLVDADTLIVHPKLERLAADVSVGNARDLQDQRAPQQR